MSNVINVAAAGVQSSAVRYNVNAAKAVKAAVPGPAPGVDRAKAMVDMTNSQVAYTASLETLRTTNKMMMGYLLNIKV